MADYRVVVDLEMCKVPKANRTSKYRWQNETIQIGAVLLNKEYEIIDSFCTVVSPEYGYIDSFIKRFTGIMQKDVIGAPKMEEALRMFTDWIPDGDVEVVSWSNSDDAQIRHEIEGKNIENPRMTELLDNWKDCQITFSEKMGSSRPYNLTEALIAADIAPEGKEHDGLCDAYNTALLFAKMETQEVFTMNKDYEAARYGEIEHLSSSLGDLFSSLNLQFAS